MDDTCVLIGLQVCFHSAMKHENGMSNVVCQSQSCENLQYAPCILSFSFNNKKLVRILEQVKPLTASRVFTDLLSNSPKRSPRFSPSYEGTENMFYFLNHPENVEGKYFVNAIRTTSRQSCEREQLST